MFNSDTYKARREELINSVKSGVILLPGNEDSPMNYRSNTYHFRQDSTFLYYFGLNRQGLTGLIDIDENKTILAGNDPGIDDIIWTGPEPSVSALGDKAGVDSSCTNSELDSILKKAIDKKRTIHYLPPYRPEKLLRIEKWTGIHHGRVQQKSSTELIMAVVKQRSVKSQLEIDEIEKAVNIAGEMHITVMKMAHPGIYEREIAGKIEGISLSAGNPVSFPVILSINGQTLHNHYHGNLLTKHKILVTDAGSQTDMCYASDITRSVPVGGKFLPGQKDIYNIVLKALEESISAIKPGIPYRDIHLNAAKIITGGLKDIGLMKGDISDAVEQGAHALFFPHGLGHALGLDVHDMEDLGEDFVGYDDKIARSDQFGLAFLRFGRVLQKNYVLTVEPGIYFIPELIDRWSSEKKFEDFINYNKLEAYRNFGGIRIEDDVAVTDNGSVVLGTPIPKTISEVEEACNCP